MKRLTLVALVALMTLVGCNKSDMQDAHTCAVEKEKLKLQNTTLQADLIHLQKNIESQIQLGIKSKSQALDMEIESYHHQIELLNIDNRSYRSKLRTLVLSCLVGVVLVMIAINITILRKYKPKKLGGKSHEK